MTRPLLDACCKSFFEWVNPVEPIIYADEFVVRYLTYFSRHVDVARILAGMHPNHERQGKPNDSSGRNADPTSDPPKPRRSQNGNRVGVSGSLAELPKGPPLSELVILAVAAIGAAMLEERDGMSKHDMQIKFILQDFLCKRFLELLRKDSLEERIKSEGSDIADALLILTEKVPEELLHWPEASFMNTNPFSCEGVFKVAKQLGIHRRAVSTIDSTGRQVWRSSFDHSIMSDRDVFRGWSEFWSIFLRDTFLAWSQHRMPVIRDEDYDQTLPQWQGRRTGEFFTAYGNLGSLNEIKSIPPLQRDHFDDVWLDVILRLAFLTRKATLTLSSVRASSCGMPVRDVENFLAVLDTWSSQLPASVTFEAVVAPFEDAAALRKDPRAFRQAIKAHLLHSIRMAQPSLLFLYFKQHGLQGTPEEEARLTPILEMCFLDGIRSVMKMGEDGVRYNVMRGNVDTTGRVFIAYAEAMVSVIKLEAWRYYQTLDSSANQEFFINAAQSLIDTLTTFDTDRRMLKLVAELRADFTKLSAKYKHTVPPPDRTAVPPPYDLAHDYSNSASMNPLMQMAGLQSLSSHLPAEGATDWLAPFISGFQNPPTSPSMPNHQYGPMSTSPSSEANGLVDTFKTESLASTAEDAETWAESTWTAAVQQRRPAQAPAPTPAPAPSSAHQHLHDLSGASLAGIHHAQHWVHRMP